MAGAGAGKLFALFQSARAFVSARHRTDEPARVDPAITSATPRVNSVTYIHFVMR